MVLVSYSLPSNRQSCLSRSSAKEKTCLPSMNTMQLCRPLGKQATTPRNLGPSGGLQDIPKATDKTKDTATMPHLKLSEKESPQKITDLLVEMITCNAGTPLCAEVSLNMGHGTWPWARSAVKKPDLPPSDRGNLLSQYVQRQSLGRRLSREEHSAWHSSSHSTSQSSSSSAASSLPTNSAQMCAVAAAADAELKAVKAKETEFEHDPAVVLQLGSEAAHAASRLRARRHRPPHPPLRLPEPMRMHLKPAVPPKIEEWADPNPEISTVTFDFGCDSNDSLKEAGGRSKRSRRAAEVSLNLSNPLSAITRLGHQKNEQEEKEEEDLYSSSDESGDDSQKDRQSPTRLLSTVFADLPDDACDPDSVLPSKVVPKLLKKTRRHQEEVAEALLDLEQNMEGMALSCRRPENSWYTGNEREGSKCPKSQHRLSIMLGLHKDDEDEAPEPPRKSTANRPAMSRRCTERRLTVTAINARSSTDVPHMFRKEELLNDETDEETNQSILGSITLHSDRDERLERLRKLTTLHRSATRRHLDGISKAERERFQEVFQRYDYNRSGGLDVVEMHDALADLGLKPSSRKDKMELARQAANQECHEFDFKQFCRTVVQRRKRALEAHNEQLKRLFQKYDTDNSGSLSADELLEVFNSLTLRAQEEDERIAFLDAVIECDVNGSGEIEWEEFEPLVQRVREKLGQCHREREVRMREQMKLPPDVFLNFRSQLIAFHEAFRRLSQAGAGQASINVKQVGTLVVDLGISRDLNSFMETWGNDEVLRGLLDHRDQVDFAIFLQVAQRLRVLREGRNGQTLRTIFDMYDVDNSGDISVDELYRLMRDLGFEIKSTMKAEVRQLFEESDIDGSGQIEYKEFPKLFHGICEMLHQRQATEEQHAAEDLGFSEEELRDLREVFQMLDVDNAGSLKFEEVHKAIYLMGETMKEEDKLWKYDQFHLGRLDFVSFLKAMKDVRPTLASATEVKKHAFVIPSVPRHRRSKE